MGTRDTLPRERLTSSLRANSEFKYVGCVSPFSGYNRTWPDCDAFARVRLGYPALGGSTLQVPSCFCYSALIHVLEQFSRRELFSRRFLQHRHAPLIQSEKEVWENCLLLCPFVNLPENQAESDYIGAA